MADMSAAQDGDRQHLLRGGAMDAVIAARPLWVLAASEQPIVLAGYTFDLAIDSMRAASESTSHRGWDAGLRSGL